jgi:hypothetical protein
MKRRTAAIFTAVALALPLAACGEPADTDLSGIDVEVMDCDAEDRRKKETPDCGHYVGGKYREWSWVSKGSKPPKGWSPAGEPAVTPAKPKTTPHKATSDKKTVTDGRSRRTTTNRNSGTSTRRR